jgi:hypothetical protein
MDDKSSLIGNPPGTYLETLPHPDGSDRAIEKAILMEHRFAFFFWMKWANRLRDSLAPNYSPPTLVTIDWHRDLAPPSDTLKEELLKLDPSDLSGAAKYVWENFEQTNDGHIRCATWLNIVGDIILLKNSAGEMQDTVSDHQGNEHNIYEFREFDRFQDFMLSRNDQHLFFDIDLDYFVHGKGFQSYSDDFRRYSDDEIKAVVNCNLPAFQHMLPRTKGITIAQEPGYCGGIRNSCQILEVVHNQLFDG